MQFGVGFDEAKVFGGLGGAIGNGLALGELPVLVLDFQKPVDAFHGFGQIAVQIGVDEEDHLAIFSAHRSG